MSLIIAPTEAARAQDATRLTATMIHTANDTIAEVRVADIARAIPTLERTIRALDRMD